MICVHAKTQSETIQTVAKLGHGTCVAAAHRPVAQDILSNKIAMNGHPVMVLAYTPTMHNVAIKVDFYN